VLLAALNARRPTRDIDFAARRLANDTTLVLRIIREIADFARDSSGLAEISGKDMAYSAFQSVRMF
jgi:hypothetical protein